MTTKNIQDAVAEKVEEFKNLPRTDDGSYCMECGGGIDEEKAVDWLRTTLTQLVKEVEAGERERVVQFLKDNGEQAVQDLWYIHRTDFEQARTPPTSDVTEK